MLNAKMALSHVASLVGISLRSSEESEFAEVFARELDSEFRQASRPCVVVVSLLCRFRVVSVSFLFELNPRNFEPVTDPVSCTVRVDMEKILAVYREQMEAVLARTPLRGHEAKRQMLASLKDKIRADRERRIRSRVICSIVAKASGGVLTCRDVQEAIAAREGRKKKIGRPRNECFAPRRKVTTAKREAAPSEQPTSERKKPCEQEPSALATQTMPDEVVDNPFPTDTQVVEPTTTPPTEAPPVEATPPATAPKQATAPTPPAPDNQPAQGDWFHLLDK